MKRTTRRPAKATKKGVHDADGVAADNATPSRLGGGGEKNGGGGGDGGIGGFHDYGLGSFDEDALRELEENDDIDVGCDPPNEARGDTDDGGRPTPAPRRDSGEGRGSRDFAISYNGERREIPAGEDLVDSSDDEG